MRDPAARVFVPGHVTGFFSVHPDADPNVAGSTGAGVALSDGATITVQRSNEREIFIEGDLARVPAAEMVAETLSATPRVDVTLNVPMGAGFGVSGAIALGTALGINQVYDRKRSENELGRIAHVADVTAGTGLGDVVAQLRGGVPIRLEPGAPGFGFLDGIPETRRIEWISYGELSTETVLAGDTGSIDQAGRAALDELRESPTLEEFMALARRFAQESNLVTPEISSVIDEVTDHGGEAAMAMLGQTVFATDRGLSDAGYTPAVCSVASSGAHVSER